MAKLTLAFLGYRQQWERDWIAARLTKDVEFIALPCTPSDTLLKRAGDLLEQTEMLICWGLPLDRIHERPG